MTDQENEQKFSKAVILLMRNVVIRENSPDAWSTITTQTARINDYVKKIGLVLIIEQENGYAYLKQQETAKQGMPKLIRKTTLSYDMSLFLVLLRKELNESGRTAGEDLCIVTRKFMIECMKLYYPKITDEVKFEKNIGALFSKAEEMKFIERTEDDEESYEVKPILISFINGEVLSDFNKALDAYMKHEGIKMEVKTNGSVQ